MLFGGLINNCISDDDDGGGESLWGTVCAFDSSCTTQFICDEEMEFILKFHFIGLLVRVFIGGQIASGGMLWESVISLNDIRIMNASRGLCL